MMFQIFFMTFRNESEHCISNKTKLTYKCLSRMEEQSHQQAAPFLFLSFSGMDGYIWKKMVFLPSTITFFGLDSTI